MIYPELGHFALILAFGLAILMAIIPLAGAVMGERLWMLSARPFASVMFLFMAVSFAALTLAFLQDDFSVDYVANHSNSLLPWYYKASAVWGGHEGSLLLWALILAGWTLAVAIFSRSLPLDMVARVLGVLGLVNIGFLSFILFTSNPFERLLPYPPADGGDLNPLLQDVGLIVHPPLLYMGYVGFSVAFAFALAALMSGRLDAAWARWSRPWTTVAWAFLTLGIALGSWWAYYELGWGGWWFWDPVENASLMPWLAGTALMHSLAVTEKRGLFKSWTVLLAIFTFALSLLGTFLVRSGILTSVHAFASDPTRGQFVLGLLAITIGGSLILYALRAPVVKSRIGFGTRSRETFLLWNNLLLVVATLTVLGGTLFPLGAEFFGAEMSVGPPYYNFMFMLLTPVLAVALGIGIFSQWKDSAPGLLWHYARSPLILSLILAPPLVLAAGEWSWIALLGLWIALWLVLSTGAEIYKRTRRDGLWRGWLRSPLSYQGMVLGHLGLAVIVVGATMVSNYDSQRDVRMVPGDRFELDGWQFHFDSIDHFEGPNFISDKGHFSIYNARGDKVAELHPEKRRYLVRGDVMTEAGIDAGFLRDFYISLGEPLPGENAWAVRLQIKPYVRWLWGGSLLMALGGFLAVADKRYRVRQSRAVKAQTAPSQAEPDVNREGVVT